MLSGTYGRGGSKKPKFPAISTSDTSTKSSSLKSNEKVSLLKKIVHAMPGSGSQSNQSQSRTMSAASQPQPHPHRDILPTRYTNTNPRNPRGRGSSTLPARPNTSPGAHPPPATPLRISFADDAPHSSMGMDTTHRNRNGNGNGNGRTPAVNLHTLTPSSSEDERSDLEHSRSVRPLSPNDIPPFTSRQPSTDNEGTAVNESPLSAPEVPRTFKAPITATGNRVLVRSSSLNDDFLRQMAPSQPQPQPEREIEDLNRIGDQKKALATLKGNLGSSPTMEGKGKPNHRLVINDNNDKTREYRITLATPATIIPRITPAPARRPISELSSFTDLLPSNFNEHTRRWSDTLISVSVPGAGAGAASPPSDPFHHLFTSCVISLILLIILAAGKDILYVIALLPVLMTLAKHFLDLNQLGLYTPLMRNNLESLLSI